MQYYNYPINYAGVRPDGVAVSAGAAKSVSFSKSDSASNVL